MKKLLLFFLCLNIFIPYVEASTSSAYEYVLMNMDSGRVLASKNKDSPRLMSWLLHNDETKICKKYNEYMP